MKTDFRPLRQDAIELLSLATRCDFRGTEFSDENTWFCCTVRNRNDIVALIIVFEFKNKFDAHVTTCVLDHRALTRKLLTTVVRAVFQKAERITALIDPDNVRALNQVWRLGFRQEGYLRRGFDGRRDALLLGLLPEDCPYLLGERFRFIRETYTHPPQASVH